MFTDSPLSPMTFGAGCSVSTTAAGKMWGSLDRGVVLANNLLGAVSLAQQHHGVSSASTLGFGVL